MDVILKVWKQNNQTFEPNDIIKIDLSQSCGHGEAADLEDLIRAYEIKKHNFSAGRFEETNAFDEDSQGEPPYTSVMDYREPGEIE